MKILGIDHSLSCTGWVYLDDLEELKVWGKKYESNPKEPLNIRIKNIVEEITKSLPVKEDYEGFLLDFVDYIFIEGSAMKANGRIIQLAELSGAIKYYFTSIGKPVFTYTPLQARKLALNIHEIPFDKEKQAKEYCKWIRDHFKTEANSFDLGENSPDMYDALVIAMAGRNELHAPSLSPDSLIMMRLHDAKILTKSNKGIYSYGTGKKKIKFKKLEQVEDPSELYNKYYEILGKK